MTTTSATRSMLYPSGELQGLLAPRSIVVVGASERPGAFGGQVLKNLIGVPGLKLYGVNPKSDQVFGVDTYPSISAIGEPADLVAICVPQAAVVSVAREAFDAGIRNAIVYSSGFAESGTVEGTHAQSQLVEFAERGMRILGPNCLGYINVHRGTELQFIEGYRAELVKGGIGVVAQSGALGYLLTQAQYRGVGFSHWVGPGNSSDVDALDLANFMLDDPNTKTVVIIFEGTPNGHRLFELGRRAHEAGKPVIVHKLGKSTIGSASARSHTGVLAGSNAVFEKAFRMSGLVVVEHFDEIIETAAMFAKVGRARANGVGIFSASGGACIIAADEAEAAAVDLPALDPAIGDKMVEFMPGFGTIGNPTDATAEAVKDPEIFRRSLEVFGTDEKFSMILIALTVASEAMTGVRARLISEFAASRPTDAPPLAVVWLSEWVDGPGAEIFAKDDRVSIFGSFRTAMAAVRSWLDWSHFDVSDLDTGHSYASDADSEAAADLARERIEIGSSFIDSETATLLLDESEGKLVISRLGITASSPQVLDSSDPDLETKLASLPYPVVAKLISRRIAHKARVGGVKLNLQTPEEVSAAVKEFAERFADDGPAQTLVERMVSGKREWFVGAKRDAGFGVVMTIGLGGVDVENTTPVLIVGEPSPQGIRTALGSAQGAMRNALNDSPRVLNELVATADRVFRLFSSLPVLADIDINPLLETDDGLIAVDAAVLVSTAPNG